MKNLDLWKDALEDTMEPATVENALAAMQRESRRVRARRHTIRVAGASVMIMLAIWFAIPKPQHALPVVIDAMASTSSLAKIEVRQLDDIAFIQRLKEAGLGIAIVGEAEDKHILLVSHDGTVFRP